MPVAPAEIIVRRRTELGLSQSQLAERIGRATSTIRRWEQGEADPPAAIIPTLANALQVSPRDLMVAFGLDSDDESLPLSDEQPPTAEEPTVPAAASPPAEQARIEDLPTQAVAAPTAVAAPPQQRPPRRSPLQRAIAVGQADGLSYVEDPNLRLRYWIRAVLTSVIGIILLVVLFWAFGELSEALGDVWDLFGEEAPGVTAPGTDF